METSSIVIKKEDPCKEEETKEELESVDPSSVSTNPGKRQRKKKQKYADELSDWDSCEENFNADRERASSSTKRKKREIDAKEDPDYYDVSNEEFVRVKTEQSDSSLDSGNSEDLDTPSYDGGKKSKSKGKPTLKCCFCSYSTRQRGHFNVHVNEVHLGGETFTCDYCNFTTNRARVLTQHNLIHTGEKPYHCHLCNYKARLQSNLTRHIRIHTGEKPFACKYCEYRCKQGYDLTKHTRIHTGEKPYACKSCDYKCSTNNGIKYHQRKHHGEAKISRNRFASDSPNVRLKSRVKSTAHPRKSTARPRKSQAMDESSQISADIGEAKPDNPLGLTDDDFIKVENVEMKQEPDFKEIWLG